jgi:hypothetical protein
LIVGQSVTPAANDKQQIEPMVQVIEQQSGQRPAGLLADSGYCSEKNLAYLAAIGSVRNFVCERLVVNGYCIAQQSPIATA